MDLTGTLRRYCDDYIGAGFIRNLSADVYVHRRQTFSGQFLAKLI